MNRLRRDADRRLTRLEREFGKAVGNALGAKGISYRTLAARLRGLEGLYVAQLGKNRRLAIEIKRRVAENLLKEAIWRGCSFGVCRKRMKALSRLGFSTVETKSTHYLFYARGALERGHKSVARRFATYMVRELESYLGRSISPWAKQDLQLLKVFLTELDERYGGDS